MYICNMKFNSPKEAFDYAVSNDLSKLDLESEKIIATNSGYSEYYAFHILKSRFKLGEKAISKNAEYSYFYALNVLKKRFKLGEKAISKNGHYSVLYAENVLKNRFKLGEEAISKNPNSCYFYIQSKFWNNEKELMAFLYLCPIGLLEKFLFFSSPVQNAIIKVLFKKKVLNNE
jgi:hypothetical protein